MNFTAFSPVNGNQKTIARLRDIFMQLITWKYISNASPLFPLYEV